MKPVDLRCESVGGVLESRDAIGLAYAAASDLRRELICPFRNMLPAELEEIAEAYRKIAEDSDLVIVEGGGIDETVARDERDYADLARLLSLEVAIVVGNRPGCLEATTHTIDYAKMRGCRILGAVLNDAVASASDENEESLRRTTDVPFLGRVRFKQPVPRTIVDALLTPV